jgi:hypothetical protein
MRETQGRAGPLVKEEKKRVVNKNPGFSSAVLCVKNAGFEILVEPSWVSAEFC